MRIVSAAAHEPSAENSMKTRRRGPDQLVGACLVEKARARGPVSVLKTKRVPGLASVYAVDNGSDLIPRAGPRNCRVAGELQANAKEERPAI